MDLYQYEYELPPGKYSTLSVLTIKYLYLFFNLKNRRRQIDKILQYHGHRAPKCSILAAINDAT